MKRNALFAAAFILFAFTLPAVSLSPGTSSNNIDLGVANQNQIATANYTVKPVVETKASKSQEEAFDEYVDDSFDKMDLRGTGLKLSIYRKALIGYQNLKRNKQLAPYKSIISIIDFSKSSRQNRLWIIDLKTNKLLYHTLVAHGRGSGGDMAEVFSNNVNSFQSSLGFYVTQNTYTGKHGLSLKLLGKDVGFNTKAMERAIVVHGADYVSKAFVKSQGRLGRSHGCPAVPAELSSKIINTIKDRTCLYIDGGVESYTSVYLNKAVAVAQFAAENNIAMASI